MGLLRWIKNNIITNFKIISLWDVSENFSKRQYIKILIALLLGGFTAIAKVLAPAALAKAVEMIALSEDDYEVSFLSFKPSGLLYLSVAFTTWIKSETYLKRLLTREFETLHVEISSLKLIAASHHIPFEDHQQNKTFITQALLEILNNQSKLACEVLNNIAPSFIDILIGLILIWRRYGNVLGSEFLVYLFSDLLLLNYFVDFVTNHSNKMAKTDKRLHGFINHEYEIINNEETVRTFHHQELETRLSKSLLTKYLNIYSRFSLAEDIAAVLRIIPIIIANIIPITLLLKEDLTLHDLDDFVFLLSYINLFGGSIAAFNQAMRNCFRATQSIERQNAFQQRCLTSPITLPVFRLRSDFLSPLIEFKNVLFCYPQSNIPVLHGVSFRIEPGKNIGIIGKSNAGKSTIVKLLFGLYRHQQGDILLNGNRIETIPKAVLARIFCCIPQNTELFRDQSLKYNVIYGVENEDLLYHCATQKHSAMDERDYHTLDVEANDEGAIRLDQAYKAAMIKVNLGNLLPHADDKTKTTSLSGGQRQRIGLARALVRNSSVFVFDESSSALDSFTESEVLANIKEITKGKTSIMITHRVVTLRNADEVLIIENGKIVEQGNPANLLKQSGVFSRYWQAQMGNS